MCGSCRWGGEKQRLKPTLGVNEEVLTWAASPEMPHLPPPAPFCTLWPTLLVGPRQWSHVCVYAAPVALFVYSSWWPFSVSQQRWPPPACRTPSPGPVGSRDTSGFSHTFEHNEHKIVILSLELGWKIEWKFLVYTLLLHSYNVRTG